MGHRYATLIRTGLRVERSLDRLPALYRKAREVCPDDFPAEETRELEMLREHVPLAFVDSLRAELAEKLSMPAEWLSRDAFTIHGCGPVSLHDDRHNYPQVYFVIVVVHSGRLGVTDGKNRATRHETGEILLLDPHRKHALLPEGRRPLEHPYERTHSPVYKQEDQFLFLCFDVKRPLIRDRFRIDAGSTTAHAG